MDDIELIDEYLDGVLPAAKKADFERRLAEDAAFAEVFVWQKALREGVIGQAGVQSIMRRLEADGHFEKPPIVPPVNLVPVLRKNYWLQIALPLLLLAGLTGWFYRENIKNYFFSPPPPVVPPPPPPQVINPPAASTQKQAPATLAPNAEAEAIPLFKKTHEPREGLMGDEQPPSQGDAIGMGSYFLKNGNIVAAEKLFRPMMSSSNDSIALWGTEGMGSVAFFRKQYRQAFQYFEKVITDTTYVDDDYKSIIEWKMFLCCAADWQHLENRGYELFDKITDVRFKHDYASDAHELQKILQAKGLWRK